MNVISLDSITKNILLKRGYSLHWYLTFLIYLKDGLRIISEDDIQVLRYKLLKLNDNHALDIPNDYLDYAKLSVRIDQYLHPMVEDTSLSIVPNYDSNFDIQPYSEGIASLTTTQNGYFLAFGYNSPYWWLVNWNALGENMGRQFGGVRNIDTFRVNKARNEIKINERLDFTEYVLEYISNGMDADSATHIDVYAQETLESYAMWQFKENMRTYSPSEAELAKQEYIAQRQILRARVSDITIEKLKRVVQGNAISIKY